MFYDESRQYHSLNIGEKNTWTDWHLVPTSRPTFAMPKMKQKVIEIPGASGVIDLSTSLTGYPLFSNRTGTFEFMVMPDFHVWTDLYSEIASYLHGKTFDCWMEDDPDYIYRGTFALSSWTSGQMYSTLIIEYSVEPYKISKCSSIELFPSMFSFDLGVNQVKRLDLTPYFIGDKPVKPVVKLESKTEGAKFNVSHIDPRTGNTVYHTGIDAGEYTFDNLIFCGKNTNLTIRAVDSASSIKVIFTPGRL